MEYPGGSHRVEGSMTGIIDQLLHITPGKQADYCLSAQILDEYEATVRTVLLSHPVWMRGLK